MKRPELLFINRLKYYAICLELWFAQRLGRWLWPHSLLAVFRLAKAWLSLRFGLSFRLKAADEISLYVPFWYMIVGRERWFSRLSLQGMLPIPGIFCVASLEQLDESFTACPQPL